MILSSPRSSVIIALGVMYAFFSLLAEDTQYSLYWLGQIVLGMCFLMGWLNRVDPSLLRKLQVAMIIGGLLKLAIVTIPFPGLLPITGAVVFLVLVAGPDIISLHIRQPLSD